MSRLIIFLVFITGLTVVMNLSKFQEPEVNNEKFDFEKKAAANMAKKLEIEKLMHPVEEKKIVEVIKELGPPVEITSPLLQKGHDLYLKCVVCHGKLGQGKTGQKAPAIGGQFDWYVETQVNNMRSGARVNKVMAPYIKRLDDEDVKALSHYISKLPRMGKR
jgi:mono/diheme cytochrome c family protein